MEQQSLHVAQFVKAAELARFEYLRLRNDQVAKTAAVTVHSLRLYTPVYVFCVNIWIPISHCIICKSRERYQFCSSSSHISR